MDLNKFCHQLLYQRSIGSDISGSIYPSSIEIKDNLKSSIRSISKFSDKETSKIKKNGGVASWEYAVNLFMFIDKLYPTHIISGDYNSVKLRTHASFKPIYSKDFKTLKFELELGKIKYLTNNFETRDFNKNILYGFIATVHSHPKFFHSDGRSQYTFFSAKDVHSLLYSNFQLVGLTMGQNLWFMGKTSESVMPPITLLNLASNVELQEGQSGLVKFIKSEFAPFGIVFYSGNLSGLLNRII